MNDLRRLIQEDIERVRRGREARARGDRGKLGHGGVMSYATWHLRAVLTLDVEHADSVFLEFLNEQEYERDAAAELARLVVPPKNEGFMRRVDYEVIWEARAGKLPKQFDEEKRKRSTGALKQRITDLLNERACAEKPTYYNFRLKALASALAAIDSQGSHDLALEVMLLPDDWANGGCVGVLESLLFNGVPLPTQRTLRWTPSFGQKIGSP
jgi:hypothetical protein